MERRDVTHARPTPPPTRTNPFLSLPSFLLTLGSDLSCRLDDSRRFALSLAASFSPPKRFVRPHLPPVPPLFASITQPRGSPSSPTAGVHVARSLLGTSVYTVSNSNNEFVLVSDPDGSKSIGLLCFRQEDAESFLAQVRLRRRELKGQAKVVHITLDQVYLLKVEGIAFRFLPDPVQIKNALELKAADTKSGFDGVPVFQSDLLVVKKKNRRFCPIYFRKEDIEKELSMISRASRGSSQHIMVGSLEDVLRKMEWEELGMGGSYLHTTWEKPFPTHPGTNEKLRNIINRWDYNRKNRIRKIRLPFINFLQVMMVFAAERGSLRDAAMDHRLQLFGFWDLKFGNGGGTIESDISCPLKL